MEILYINSIENKTENTHKKKTYHVKVRTTLQGAFYGHGSVNVYLLGDDTAPASLVNT